MQPPPPQHTTETVQGRGTLLGSLGQLMGKASVKAALGRVGERLRGVSVEKDQVGNHPHLSG